MFATKRKLLATIGNPNDNQNDDNTEELMIGKNNALFKEKMNVFLVILLSYVCYDEIIRESLIS